MNNVVRRKKKTLFGRVIRKIESELTLREDKLILQDVPLDDIRTNDDTAIIESRRDELRSAKHDNSDEFVVRQTTFWKKWRCIMITQIKSRRQQAGN